MGAKEELKMRVHTGVKTRANLRSNVVGNGGVNLGVKMKVNVGIKMKAKKSSTPTII